jgi:hypothetical protein
MLHESLKVNKFTIKDNGSFRVRVETWEVTSPKGLYNLDFIQECLDKDGNVEHASTYNFFMTKEEIGELCKGLLAS